MYHEYRTLIFATLSHQKNKRKVTLIFATLSHQKNKRKVTLIFAFSLIDVCLFDGNSGLFLSLFSFKEE